MPRPPASQALDYAAIAEKVVGTSANVKEGEIVHINGGPQDLGLLEELVVAEAPPEEIQAQAGKVQTLHRELADAKVDLRETEAAADREQAQADRAARDLQDAEAGRPRLVAEPADRQPGPPTDLRDRLG